MFYQHVAPPFKCFLRGYVFRLAFQKIIAEQLFLDIFKTQPGDQYLRKRSPVMPSVRGTKDSFSTTSRTSDSLVNTF